MRLFLSIVAFAAVVLALPLSLAAEDQPPDDLREFPARPAGEIDSSVEAIAREISALGADDGATREAATLHLFWIGEPSRAALTEALQSKDAEVRDRAARVLRMLDRITGLTDVTVRFMVRGYCLAGTRKADDGALGGFGPSENYPRPVPSEVQAKDGELQLIADPGVLTVFGKSHKGMRVLLVNATNNGLSFDASDSRLSIIQEAQDEDGAWKPIEYLPQSW